MKPLSLNKPHLLVVIGVPGAGKSFFAERFAETFHAPRVSFDAISAAVAGDWPSHSRQEQAITNELARDQLAQLMITGSTVIVDGGSDSRTERQELARLARSHGYETLYVWVQTDPITARQRAESNWRRRQQQLPADRYEALVRRLTPPNQTEPTVVVSGKHTYATQAKTVLKKLSQPRTEQVDRAAKVETRPTKPNRRVFIR